MEQVFLMNVGGLRTLDSQIGVYLDDEFMISDECLGKIRFFIIVFVRQLWTYCCAVHTSLHFYFLFTEALEEIYKGLLQEDKNSRYFRRYCASSDIVRKVSQCQIFLVWQKYIHEVELVYEEAREERLFLRERFMDERDMKRCVCVFLRICCRCCTVWRMRTIVTLKTRMKSSSLLYGNFVLSSIVMTCLSLVWKPKVLTKL